MSNRKNNFRNHDGVYGWRLDFDDSCGEAHLTQDGGGEDHVIILSCSQLPALAGVLLDLHQAETGSVPVGRVAPPQPGVPSIIQELRVDEIGRELVLCQPGRNRDGTDDANIWVSPDQVELLCAQLRAARDSIWATRKASKSAPEDVDASEPVGPQ